MNICIVRGALGPVAGNPDTEKFFAERVLGERVWLKVLKDGEQRTLSQNSLYWLWLTEIGRQRGHTKDDLHERFKRHYVLPVLVRDDPDYGAFLDKVQGLGAEAYEEFVRRHISTTDLSVKQFTEVLNEIHVDASQRGIRLTNPDDRILEAA